MGPLQHSHLLTLLLLLFSLSLFSLVRAGAGVCVTVKRSDGATVEVCDALSLPIGFEAGATTKTNTTWFKLHNDSPEPRLALLRIEADHAFNQLDLSLYSESGRKVNSYFPESGTNNAIGFLRSRFLWLQVQANEAFYIPFYSLISPRVVLGNYNTTLTWNPDSIVELPAESSATVTISPGQYQGISSVVFKKSATQVSTAVVLELRTQCTDVVSLFDVSNAMVYGKFPVLGQQVVRLSSVDDVGLFYSEEIYQDSTAIAMVHYPMTNNTDPNHKCELQVEIYSVSTPAQPLPFRKRTVFNQKGHRVAALHSESPYLSNESSGSLFLQITETPSDKSIYPLQIFVGVSPLPIGSLLNYTVLEDSTLEIVIPYAMPWVNVAFVPHESNVFEVSTRSSRVPVSFWVSYPGIILYSVAGLLIVVSLAFLIRWKVRRAKQLGYAQVG